MSGRSAWTVAVCGFELVCKKLWVKERGVFIEEYMLS
jgi:hypothetical protein